MRTMGLAAVALLASAAATGRSAVRLENDHVRVVETEVKMEPAN